MVLYYGLLALERANNTVAITTSKSRQGSLSKQVKSSEKMSSNSWIYTEDLRKRFEERYGDYRYVLIPVYISNKTGNWNSNSTGILSQSFRPYGLNSISKNSEPNQKTSNKKKFFSRTSSLKNHSILTSHSTNVVNPMMKDQSRLLKTNVKHANTHQNRLTRLCSFFFKSTSLLSTTQE